MRLHGNKYKKARDDNSKRAAEDRPQDDTELAAYCGPNKSDKLFRACFAATNAIFGTIPDGRKQALGKKTPQEKLEAKKCPVCGQQDSQRHRYLECRHADFEEIRQKAHKLQLDVVDKIR
jgi:hypothetical protein